MASSASGESGIESSIFQTKVPEMLLCKLCNQVPKYPMKVATCAHIFCKSCFHPYRTLAVKNSVPLICPVDQKNIEFHQVLYDEETETFIGNQPVNCPQKNKGCKWQGPYKSMEAHLKMCEKKDKMEEVLQRLMKMEEKMVEKDKEGLERLTKMEEKMVEKDKEINFLKNHNEVQISYGLKNKLRQQKEENEELKLKVYELTRANEDEVATQEAVNGEFKEEVNNLKKQIEEMAGRLNELEEQGRGEENKEVKSKPESSKSSNQESTLRKLASNVAAYIPIKKTPQVYLDMTIDKTPVGRIIIVLYKDLAPKTCHKFCHFITGEPGWGYKDEKFNCVTPQYLEVGYQVMKGNKEKYAVPRENVKAKHDKKGLVTLPTYPGTSGDVTWTMFYICSQPRPSGDGCATIIGHVTDESWHVVEKMLEVPRTRFTPSKDIRISDCGEIS